MTLTKELRKKFKTIKSLVTNTPIVEINYSFNGSKHKVYAKCEWYSLTGSIKDKVAYQIFFDAYTNEQLHTGDKIVEVSSGNMGISICAVANLLGNPVTIIMPKNMSSERKSLIRQLGATLVETDDFKSAFDLCEEYKKNGYFCTEQFANTSNIKAHALFTAHEIIKQLKNKNIYSFVAGVGTSGTLVGVGKSLKKSIGTKIVAIEPSRARILSNIPPFCHHKIQGISDEIVPSLYDDNIIDEIIPISDRDAIAMSQKLCTELSLPVGISSGANFLGCVLSEKNAVTTFADDNKKYLSTDLSKPIHTELVDSIELINFKLL